MDMKSGVELVCRIIVTSACLLGTGYGAILCNAGKGMGALIIVPSVAVLAVGMAEPAYRRGIGQ